MIRFDDTYVGYPGTQEVLHAVSFFIDRGQMCFLTGRTGAGKSTVLRAILKLVTPFHGAVTVNGVNVNSLTKARLPIFRRQIGVVLQDPQLLPDRTVFDNVAIPLMIVGMRGRSITTRVQTALDLVGLEDYQHRAPLTLSAGEQQRVGVARALVNNPALVLADEPTGNLDPPLSREILKLFENFNSHGTTVLIATHEISLLKDYQKYPMLQLEQGKVMQLV